MNDDLTGMRLKAIEDNIRQDLDLLKGYEDELRYETDHRTMVKCRRDIERQRESLASQWEEYNELKQKVAAGSEIQNLADILQQKKKKTGCSSQENVKRADLSDNPNAGEENRIDLSTNT